MHNDGGPAFPRNGHPDKNDLPCGGMTLRDYFAAAALTGMLANADTGSESRSGAFDLWPERTALSAYQYADEMLKAREVQGV